MFNFLSMMDNYDQRKIDRYESDDVMVSTALINDAEKPYETAVSHKAYNDGNLIIVEDYDSPDEAQEGHDKWVVAMTSDELPEQLTDIMTDRAAQLLSLFSDPGDNIHKKDT